MKAARGRGRATRPPSSATALTVAIAGNIAIAAAKFTGAFFTGSSAMIREMKYVFVSVAPPAEAGGQRSA